MPKCNEGGEIRTLDLGIKSSCAIDSETAKYPAIQRDGSDHSYPTTPEASPIIRQSPTESPTAVPYPICCRPIPAWQVLPRSVRIAAFDLPCDSGYIPRSPVVEG